MTHGANDLRRTAAPRVSFETGAPAAKGYIGSVVPSPDIQVFLQGSTDVPSSPATVRDTRLRSGTIVDGRYRVCRQIGRGAMGIVYLARDLGLDRDVALKVVDPTWSNDPAIIPRFHQEARCLASVRSPNVVQVHAFGQHRGAWFFVMEHVRGRTLGALLAELRARRALLPLDRVLEIVRQVGAGLEAVHEAGLVHRDIKPGNIVIEEGTGRLVLVDFGLAVPEAFGAATSGGTFEYMPPEQATMGGHVTARSDVYALACTVFEVLTGDIPFTADDAPALVRKHASEPPPPVSSRRPGGKPFDPVLARALAKDPAQRYPSCAAFADALTEAACHLGDA